MKIGIIGCKIVMDNLCPGCAKCFNALNQRTGKFAELKGEHVDVVFLTSCGSCPGPVTMKVDLITRTLSTLGTNVDVVYLATCVQRAVESFNCPIDLGLLKRSLEGLGYKVVIGTHEYPIFRV